MILLEFVSGETLFDKLLGAGAYDDGDSTLDISELDYQLLPPENKRLDVLSTVIETEVALFHAGIAHRPTGPSDVLVPHMPSRQAILINFHGALVYKRYEWGRKYLEHQGLCPKPISPVERWWEGEIVEIFGGWVPQSWLELQDKDMEWLYFRWIGSDQYMELSEEFQRQNRKRLLLVRGTGQAEWGN